MFGIKKSQIVQKIEELISPLAEERSIEVVLVEFNQDGRVGQLRIFIDKPGGVTINDCAGFNKEVGALLDVEDIIGSEYTLEVSSPGFDRPITKAKDFERFLGHKVFIHLTGPLNAVPEDSQRNYRGTLSGYESGIVRVVTGEGNEVAIPEDLITKASLDD